MRARFKREALLSKRIRHAGVLEAIDYHFGSEVLNGECFIVFPFVWGLTLKDFLELLKARNRELTIEQALTIMWDILDILITLEEAKILHRDLKPDNFMLAPNHPNNVVLLDFGFSTDPNDPAQLTGRHTIVGNMDYAAPELRWGGSARADIRSEIFALGVSFIKIFHPRLSRFEKDGEYISFAENPIATPLTDDLIAKENRPGVPEELVPLINRMIDHQPNNRFKHFWQIQRACEYLLFDLCCR